FAEIRRAATENKSISRETQAKRASLTIAECGLIKTGSRQQEQEAGTRRAKSVLLFLPPVCGRLPPRSLIRIPHSAFRNRQDEAFDVRFVVEEVCTDAYALRFFCDGDVVMREMRDDSLRARRGDQ